MMKIKKILKKLIEPEVVSEDDDAEKANQVFLIMAHELKYVLCVFPMIIYPLESYDDWKENMD